MKTIDPIMPAAALKTGLLENIPGVLEQAQQAGTLVVGVHDIWKQLWRNKPGLLLIEKGFVCLAWHVDMENICMAGNDLAIAGTSPRNILDDISTRAETAGATVLIVPAGFLGQYHGMALVLEQPPAFSIY